MVGKELRAVREAPSLPRGEIIPRTIHPSIHPSGPTNLKHRIHTARWYVLSFPRVHGRDCGDEFNATALSLIPVPLLVWSVSARLLVVETPISFFTNDMTARESRDTVDQGNSSCCGFSRNSRRERFVVVRGLAHVPSIEIPCRIELTLFAGRRIRRRSTSPFPRPSICLL